MHDKPTVMSLARVPHGPPPPAAPRYYSRRQIHTLEHEQSKKIPVATRRTRSPGRHCTRASSSTHRPLKIEDRRTWRTRGTEELEGIDWDLFALQGVDLRRDHHRIAGSTRAGDGPVATSDSARSGEGTNVCSTQYTA